jgi:hypothetical protein
MTIKINDAALRHARQLIKDARIARDTRDDWSEHAPDTEKENAYIAKHGYTECGTWNRIKYPSGSATENLCAPTTYGSARRHQRRRVHRRQRRLAVPTIVPPRCPGYPWAAA